MNTLAKSILTSAMILLLSPFSSMAGGPKCNLIIKNLDGFIKFDRYQMLELQNKKSNYQLIEDKPENYVDGTFVINNLLTEWEEGSYIMNVKLASHRKLGIVLDFSYILPSVSDNSYTKYTGFKIENDYILSRVQNNLVVDLSEQHLSAGPYKFIKTESLDGFEDTKNSALSRAYQNLDNHNFSIIMTLLKSLPRCKTSAARDGSSQAAR